VPPSVYKDFLAIVRASHIVLHVLIIGQKTEILSK
jgi:hypothetical protein